MRRRLTSLHPSGRWAALVAALLASVGLAAPTGAAETLEEVLAAHHEAHGGAGALRAVETLVGTGVIHLGGGTEAPLRYEWKRPNKFRVEITIQGTTEVQASDGATAWTINPPQTAAVAMAPVDLLMLNDAADYLGALIDGAAKGHRVELVGPAEVEGTPAVEVRVARKEGFAERIFLDAEHHLEIFEVEEHTFPSGATVEMETTRGDFKEVGGVLLPHFWSRHPKGDPDATLTLVFDSLKVNEPIADDRFTMPAAEPEPAE